MTAERTRQKLIMFARPIWDTPQLRKALLTSGYAAGLSLPFNMMDPRPDSDLYLASLHRDDTDVVSQPAGWTSLYGQAGMATMYHRLAYRVGNSEPASYNATIPSTPGGRHYHFGALRITGADTADPINNHAIATGTGTSMTAPALTVDEDNTLVLRFFMADNSMPSAEMGVAEAVYRHDAIGQQDIHVLCIVEQGPANGQSTGTKSISLSASTQWLASTVAINRA